MSSQASTQTFVLPGMTCGHCVAAITEEVSKVEGVAAVDIDLETKRVVVGSQPGMALDNGAIRAAIDEAGFEANP